jgi:N-acetylmuramoyl-L-alanine amidase
MQTRRKHKEGSLPIRRDILLVAGRVMLVIAAASLLAAGLIGWRTFAPDAHIPLLAALQPASRTDAEKRRGTVQPNGGVAADTPHIGIVAGHAGYDPGAVCPDGWTEADVNKIIAEEVQNLLLHQGYQVDLLQEFDARLNGYRADALVSIHADSCEVPDASGFKVARVTASVIPEAEDRLVGCLYQEYEKFTHLPRHPGSITDDMTSYHAFREIDDQTPGAIIETGFLLGDRSVLIRRPKLAAQGIAAGITCFLEGKK